MSRAAEEVLAGIDTKTRDIKRQVAINGNATNDKGIGFSSDGVTLVTPFPFYQLIQSDKVLPIILDVDVLCLLSAGYSQIICFSFCTAIIAPLRFPTCRMFLNDLL